MSAPSSAAGADGDPAAEPPVYLDHNATTPVLPEALAAMLPFLSHRFGNPSSGHAHGRAMRAALDQARAQVAELIGCAEDEVVFTSGGTESSNLAIRGIAALASADRREIVTSVVEHPATLATCAALAGFSVKRAPVDERCRIVVDAARDLIGQRCALVTLMHVNNETGAIQPIAEIASRARAVGAAVHVDGAQSVGKIPVGVDDLGADLLSIAAHKLGGPPGIGALFVRRGVTLEPIARGAGHERGLRPGTENVAGAVGLGAACAAAGQRMSGEMARLRALREALFDALSRAVPGLVRLVPDPALEGGGGQACLPNTLHVRFPGCGGDSVLALAPDVAATTGSACHSGGDRTASAVIVAMGVPADEALGSVRLSLGWTSTAGDVERAAASLGAAWRRARTG